MMGMGEPLLNLDNVLKAVRLMGDPEGRCDPDEADHRVDLRHHPEDRRARLEPEVRPKLAISLNASTEEFSGGRMMPLTKKYHLADLLEACRRYPLRSLGED